MDYIYLVLDKYLLVIPLRKEGIILLRVKLSPFLETK